MVLVVPLAFTLYAPYFLARFWASRLVLFQNLHFQTQAFQLCVDLLDSQNRILYWGLVQSHCDLQRFCLSG